MTREFPVDEIAGDAVKGRKNTIPAPHSLLKWVYVGRFCVATAVFVAGSFFFRDLSPGVLLTVSVTAVLSFVATGVSFFYTHVSQRPPTVTFLYTQSLIDLGLVTAVVHVTGGVNSDFASLYILVIGFSAVTMPAGSAVLVTLTAAVLYIADAVLGSPVTVNLSVWLQISVFVAVALATSWLASKVRVVGVQQRELEREVKRLRLEAGDILREISGGVITVAEDGTLIYANESAERFLDFSMTEFVGRPVLKQLGERSHELCQAIVETQRSGRRQVRAEGWIEGPDGSFPIGVTTTAHQLEAGQLPSVTAIFTDISSQKRLNELRMRTDRLEAVASLSASLAHEIKNPLASIRSSVEQLGESVRTDPDDRFLAQLIVRESDRLSRLLSEFLDFSRVQMVEPHSVDLFSVAQMAVDVAREHPDCRDDADVEVIGTPCPISGDEDLLHRVVLNLVLNALQATGANARVVVSVRAVPASDLPTGVPSDHGAVLEVSDNGPGIPDHIRQHLFDPFVTAREGGTGLGLAIVQRAVEAHHGLVLLESSEAAGTTFSVYFPTRKPSEVAA